MFHKSLYILGLRSNWLKVASLKKFDTYTFEKQPELRKKMGFPCASKAQILEIILFSQR